ncbi:Hypothetical protein CINCED_3A003664 [Cinara cedri]|uniref:Protein FMC1 homolog n=1 Tax=Cinara cedri TaxID=506608 RepID=A0A5E4M987_9HEMI|nr:Hypothetical protein CINCED_3A003664 [Cinara cedri]
MFERSSLALLRSLARELRLRHSSSSGSKRILDRPLVRFLLSEYRFNRVTPAQYCRGPDEMAWIADTYMQYLRAQRVCRELSDEHQKQEKTVQQTADMIGFRLPPNNKID